MRTFKFDKLVRDKIAVGITKGGGVVVSRRLGRQEYIDELIKKLTEESAELSAQLDKQKAVSELADIEEILEALRRALGISPKALSNVRQKKNQIAGAFRRKIFIECVSVPDNYKWIGHYLANPKRYPEIKTKKKM